jgi:hypothetical protein
MTLLRTLRPSLLAGLLSALLAAPAYGDAVVPEAAGGAQSPSAPLSGGSEYGLAGSSAVPHPVVTKLTVPSTAVPGRPPRVTLRIDEAHVGTVNVTVAVNNLTTRKPAFAVHLGWVHTARTLNVAWPHGATLAAGTYHVSVSAHDHHAHNLTRTAHSSGVATLTVVAPAPPPAPITAPAPVVEPGVPTPAQTVADGAVFPVAGPHNFGNAENRYGAPRANHIHEGQDILTAEGTPARRATKPQAPATTPSSTPRSASTSSSTTARLRRCSSAPTRPSHPAQRSARPGRAATRPRRTCISRCGSAAGMRQAGTRSTRCRISKLGNTAAEAPAAR